MLQISSLATVGGSAFERTSAVRRDQAVTYRSIPIAALNMQPSDPSTQTSSPRGRLRNSGTYPRGETVVTL